MDVLRAEIAKKRKLLEEQKLVDGKKKYFKRGELLEKERDEYVQKYLAKDVRVNPSSSMTYQHSDAHNNLRDTTADIRNLPRSEVIRKLRERGEPILLFGESEIDACSRLRQFEITAPEINRGFRNDFQEAMDQVDQAYLDEMLVDQTNINKDKNKNDDIDLDENVSYESIQEEAATLGRGNKEHDMNVIEMLLKFLLKLWYEQSNAKSTEEKMRTKTKMLRATFTQTRVYLKPLLRKLKRHSIPDDILDSLTVITKNLLKRDYILASDAYLTMAIGNAPWPIGVTMVGIHARTGREKIFSKNVAHVMNDETQRKYIQGLKRLMTKCQEFYPTDPSRCVEYVSKKDLQNT